MSLDSRTGRAPLIGSSFRDGHEAPRVSHIEYEITLRETDDGGGVTIEFGDYTTVMGSDSETLTVDEGEGLEDVLIQRLRDQFEEWDNKNATPPTRENIRVNIESDREVFSELTEHDIFEQTAIDEFVLYGPEARVVVPQGELEEDDIDVTNLSWVNDSAIAPQVDEPASNIMARGAELNPDKVYALVSGGHDSLTALAVAWQSDDIELDGVVHVNTGVGIPETREFVKARAKAYDVEYIELMNTRKGEMYHDLVQKFQHPGPPTHIWQYANLKEKPLKRFLSSHDDEKIGLISGVRKDESDRRAVNIPDSGIEEDGRGLWISNIANWSDDQLTAYRKANGLPENMVKVIMEMSGECLCGAFSARSEAKDINEWFPNVMKQIERLELVTLNRTARREFREDRTWKPIRSLWGHGGANAREQDARMHEQETFDVPDEEQPNRDAQLADLGVSMCSDCEQRSSCTFSPDPTEPLTLAERLIGENEGETMHNDVTGIFEHDESNDGEEEEDESESDTDLSPVVDAEEGQSTLVVTSQDN